MSELHPALRALGEVAALADVRKEVIARQWPGFGSAGEEAISFLKGATAFILGGRLLWQGVPEKDLAVGRHEFAHDFQSRPHEGTMAATKSVRVGNGRPLRRMTVGYTMPGQGGNVGAVDVSLEFPPGDGMERFHYTRLSAGRGTPDKQTLRIAVGYITAHGILRPDMQPTFDYAAAIGEKLAAYPAQR